MRGELLPVRHLPSGFSLVELLISMVVLTSIIFLGSYAYAVFIAKWDGQLGKFDQKVEQSRNLILLHRVLQGITPYVVENDNGDPMLAFDGRSSTITTVTSAPLFSDGLATVMLLVEHGESATRLEYFENPGAGYSETQLKAGDQWRYHKLLLAVDSPLIFSFFAWPSLEQKVLYQEGLSISGQHVVPGWYKAYNAKTTQMLPLAISLSLGEEGMLLVDLADKAEQKLAPYHDNYQ
ncbi:PulJ/GspJ family protein [Bowmanella dokdonensis]|uniref:Prepilin-type N-terminal cleavage/methylation domain-containing protein n=1 Tax=Bowmanella dokdonensis TaxID=751969 RepID=A0A939DTB7_9ALTE|nr:prepilin-type N-terminal cleavage/methylation domain-containing protein [Bowmanella dokdonensis]MBN7827531.1 prepilin-type N-terminal cleavage/methylation domain-containing protein [Bowmanella dokdonensis]